MNDHDAKQIVESMQMQTARIAAIERFVKDLAIASLGDSPETASFLDRIDRYYSQKLREIQSGSHEPPRHDPTDPSATL